MLFAGVRGQGAAIPTACRTPGVAAVLADHTIFAVMLPIARGWVWFIEPSLDSRYSYPSHSCSSISNTSATDGSCLGFWIWTVVICLDLGICHLVFAPDCSNEPGDPIRGQAYLFWPAAPLVSFHKLWTRSLLVKPPWLNCR